jgi:hypothetical protein
MWLSYNVANNNNYNENIRLFAANNGVSVIGFRAGANTSGGQPDTSLLGFSSYFETRVGSQWQERLYANYAEAYGSYRAPIFYDSDNTAFFLNPATTATSLRVAGGIKQDNLVGRPYAVWGATGATGAVVIKFPGGTGNYGMIHAEIDVYEYSGNAAATIIVGGHNWNGAWYNINAEVVGQTDKPVRVGVKDGRYCIVIGNGSSSWSYGQVVLRKIQNGSYYSGIMDVAEGYSVAIESDSYSNISGDLRNLRTPVSFTAGTNVTAGNAMYSPIYYDSNNSAYYVDGDNQSRLLALKVGNTGNFNSGNTYALQLSHNNRYLIALSNTSYSSLYYPWLVNDGWNGYEALIFHFNGIGDRFYFNRAGQMQADGDMRAPIFYDSNNTAYYINPDSTSNLVGLNVNSTLNMYARSYYTNYLVSRDSGGLMGDYNVTGTSSKVIWTIGESWPIGNMYGLGYEYGSGYDHHLALRNNGTTYSRFGFAGGAFIGGNLTLGSDLYAYRFYDRDNTAYYCDPAGTSNMVYLVIAGGNSVQVNSANNAGGYAMNNSGQYWGLMLNVGSQDWRLGYGSTTSIVGWNLRWDNGSTVWANGSFRAPIFYDSDDTGYYINPNGASYVRGRFEVAGGHGDSSLRIIARGNEMGTGTPSYLQMWVSEPGVTWNDGGFGFNVHNDGGSPSGFSRINTGQGQAYMRFNTGGNTYFYNTNTSGTRYTTMEWYSDGTVYANNYLTGGNSLRAPIFYDSNNTAYYVDPNGTARLSYVVANGGIRIDANEHIYLDNN